MISNTCLFILNIVNILLFVYITEGFKKYFPMIHSANDLIKLCIFLSWYFNTTNAELQAYLGDITGFLQITTIKTMSHKNMSHKCVGFPVHRKVMLSLYCRLSSMQLHYMWKSNVHTLIRNTLLLKVLTAMWSFSKWYYLVCWKLFLMVANWLGWQLLKVE